MDGNEEEAAAEEDEEAIDPLIGFRGGWTTKQPYSGKRKKERKRDQKGKGGRKRFIQSERKGRNLRDRLSHRGSSKTRG